MDSPGFTAMSKPIKQLELDDLRATFQNVKDYVLLEPVKVDSATEYEFRKKLRGNKIRVKLVKNSYAKKIFAELGLNVQETTWTGPTLLCWGADSVKSLAKNVDTAVKESRKDPKAPEKFKVKGAVADGQATTLDIAKTMPTRLEAIAEVLGAILGPGATLAAAITGPGSTVVNLITAIEDKAKDTAPEAAPAA